MNEVFGIANLWMRYNCLRLIICKALLVSAILVSLAVPSLADSTQTTGTPSVPPKHRAAKSSKAKAHSRRSRSRRGAWKRHGQQQIQPERASAIQQALIREKYLSGEPNGEWDARTQAAMSRYQTDNGWQSKITPDSRALIKLGLGPDYSDKNMMLFVPKAGSSDAVAASAVGTAGTTSKQR